MPAIRRTLKNVVKNYSDAQVKVREATSNDPWGPSSTLMSEIADLTYNVIAFTDIMQMVWKRLNDDGKNWRHVYKSLVVLDYIIKTGSEKVAQQCKENFHAIKTLTSFQYIDTDNKDQGINVREKAKQLVTMLSDDERLKNERTKALKAKERFAQNSMGVGNGPGRAKVKDETKTEGSPIPGGSASPVDTQASPGSASTPNEMECARPSSAGEEELQLQLALAMSKEEHDETLRKQKSDDIKLQMAIEQSREQVKTENKRHQQMKSPGGGTLLHLAGPSTSHGASAASASATKDPWGAPLPSSQPAPAPTDPWGAPLPPPAAKPDPWGSSPSGGDGRIYLPPAYSPSFNAPPPATTPPQPADPWGLPPPEPAATANAPLAGAWASSPTSSSQQASAWGGPSSASAGAGLDAFGAPATNGTSGGVATIDSEFDLLSARSNESSPVKSSTAAQGLEEFDLLSGGNPTNGTSAWDNQNKKKKAEDFLGDNANLVNLDQLVSKAPPKGNNPFAMTVGNSNPFQDPNAGVRVPMAQMQGTANAPAPGFSQPISSGLLPSPLVPSGTQPMPQPQPQQGYNPFL